MGKDAKDNEKIMISRAIKSVKTRIEYIEDSSIKHNLSQNKMNKKIEIQEFIFDVLKFYESYISDKSKYKKDKQPIQLPDNMIELPCTVNQLLDKYKDILYNENPSEKYKGEVDPYILGYAEGMKKGKLMILEYLLKYAKYKDDYIV